MSVCLTLVSLTPQQEYSLLMEDQMAFRFAPITGWDLEFCSTLSLVEQMEMIQVQTQISLNRHQYIKGCQLPGLQAADRPSVQASDADTDG